MKIAVGTDKGLLIYEGSNHQWQLQDIHFLGMPIGAFHQDQSRSDCMTLLIERMC